MKDVSQTQLEAGTPQPKRKIRVGSWNVRTLYQVEKLQQVLREVECYNIELLCVIVARWIDSGKRTCPLDIPFFILAKQNTSTEAELP